ncbi:MAG: pilin [Xanthomonadaceae bacterium]|nr:pilin [Xanthomonadaceae bacterium]
MSTPPQFPPGPPPAMRQPPPKKMSGCAIAAIIGAVVGFFGIVLIGILAAIAIPAYQQYLTRSQIVQAHVRAETLQTNIDRYREANDACPDNAALGLDDNETHALDASGTRHADMKVGETEPGHCTITLTFRGALGKADATTLVMESNGSEWTCTGGSLPTEMRPPRCRTGLAPTY